jgi:hypothetical protein
VGGLVKYCAIELNKRAFMLRTGDVAVFPVECCSSECRTEYSCKLTTGAGNMSLFPYSEPFKILNVYQLELGLYKY